MSQHIPTGGFWSQLSEAQRDAFLAGQFEAAAQTIDPALLGAPYEPEQLGDLTYETWKPFSTETETWLGVNELWWSQEPTEGEAEPYEDPSYYEYNWFKPLVMKADQKVTTFISPEGG